MVKVYCGLDFGTTNSSVAVSDGTRVQLLELDPLNDNPTLLPSLLYVSRAGEQIVGRAAANAFMERNVDREVTVQQVDLGVDIEAYVGAEPDKSEGYRPPLPGEEEVREAIRASAVVEVNAPGRLFQSVKSSLRYKAFKGTNVFGRHYQIEELVALILRPMKEAADSYANQSISTLVLGRPVWFSPDDEEDRLAEQRLLRAAHIAGFEHVVFFYEPVAACIEYAVATERRQRLMVVDIGGGTCDVCVMEFGGAKDRAARLAESRILGVAGVPVAGDFLDREIIRARLFPCFGSRSRYGPSKLPMPQYLYSYIADWQNLYKLNSEETINWLIAVEASSTQPESIRALRTLIQRNYGYPLTRKVEQAKKLLTYEWEAPIELHHADTMHISIRLGRSEFCRIIEPALHDMLACLKEAEKTAEVSPSEIDCILTTGGTTLTPAVRQMLAQRYGADRLLHRETFTSVATGLAIAAQFV